MAHLSSKLTNKLVVNLGFDRHGDGNVLYLVVGLSGARRCWNTPIIANTAPDLQFPAEYEHCDPEVAATLKTEEEAA